MKYDLPPTENIARPNIDSRIEQRIRNIARTDSQMPFLRLVWGASLDSTYLFGNEETGETEQHMVYRDHIHREHRIGWPAYNLDGSFSHYQQLFKPGDVTPPDAYLEGVTLETDIGIPRWFIEYATAVDPEQWETARWTNERGEVRVGPTGNAIDFRGPCPEGAVVYEPLWLCADHKGCCVKVGHSNIGAKRNKEQCFGIYRDPNNRDVRECEARWAQVLESRVNTYGLRDSVPDSLVRQDVSTAAIGHRDYWLKREEEIAGDYLQNMMPHSKRLTTHSHGMDLAKYKDVGGVTQKIAENSTDPNAWSGKILDSHGKPVKGQ